MGTIHSATPAGVSATHPASDPLQLLVGPATSSEFNAARLRIIPIACWKVEDILFAFDSSFLTPQVTAHLKELQSLRELHKDAASGKYPPLSIFGHADPVGPANDPDGYNKALAGRRATVVYAVLIVNSDPDTAVNLWQQVASTEKWGQNQQQIMQAQVPSGTSDSDLVKTYLQQLCPSDFTLTAQDFLAQGTGTNGKGDYQGCSSFNPLLIFSQQTEDQYDQAEQNGDQTTLQARNAANACNRRVMVLLFRVGSLIDPTKWPCPSATDDKSGCLLRFWADGDTRRHKRLPDTDRKFDDTKDTFACRFYQRLLTGSPCEKNIPAVPAVLEIILDSDNDFTVDASEPVATFVRVGIWDHAFNASNGQLINNVADSQNFVGKDSKGPQARRFYFRVRDENAAGTNSLQVNWRTEFGAGGTDDAPANQIITLTPTSDPSVFVSHAVFLVTDADDQGQATNSGLGPGDADKGNRTLGQSNHRLRLMTVDDTHILDSKVVAEYTPINGGTLVSASAPVFQRSPEERLKMNVHLVNVRATAGGAGALRSDRKQLAIDTIRSVYARCGIYVNCDEIQIDPPASCINWATRYPSSPLAIGVDPAVEGPGFVSGNLVASTSQADIISAVRSQSGFNANDVYVVYTNRIFNNPAPAASPTAILTQGPGGIAMADSWTAANSTARGFVFVGVQTVNQFADPHEITHMTTDLRNTAGGHFHLEASITSGPGNIDGRNLMQRFVLIANGDPADSKRLWDEDFTNNNLSPAKLPAQITAIRASRFVHPF